MKLSRNSNILYSTILIYFKEVQYMSQYVYYCTIHVPIWLVLHNTRPNTYTLILHNSCPNTTSTAQYTSQYLNIVKYMSHYK